MPAPALPTPAEVEALLLASPFHQWLGLEVADVQRDAIELRAQPRPEWANSVGGVVHGGILASLLDLAADWALVGTVGTAVPTVDLTVHYLRAAELGPLAAVGRLVRPGRQVSVAEAEVRDERGRVLAVGRGAYLSAVAAASSGSGDG